MDREAALALQQQIGAFSGIGLAVSSELLTSAQSIEKQFHFKANTIGRLSISVAQAKLVKNYGLTRMVIYEVIINYYVVIDIKI